jgi:hypothetical protein
MAYNAPKHLGDKTVIEQLYRPKDGPVVKPELPSGATGPLPKAVDRAGKEAE